MALKNGRNYVGLDISEEYLDVAERRVSPLKADVAANDNQLEMF